MKFLAIVLLSSLTILGVGCDQEPDTGKDEPAFSKRFLAEEMRVLKATGCWEHAVRAEKALRKKYPEGVYRNGSPLPTTLSIARYIQATKGLRGSMLLLGEVEDASKKTSLEYFPAEKMFPPKEKDILY